MHSLFLPPKWMSGSFGIGIGWLLIEALVASDKAIFFNCLFICVEVLRPSQPNGVMSSAVSLPNHTFTGQA